MTIRPGEFWVAEITFTDGTSSYRRPVLVLWVDGGDLVAAAVTSAPARSVSDVAIADWRSSGLRVASTVRLSRLDCLEHSLMIARIGEISPRDASLVKSVWMSCVKPQF